MDIVNHHVHLIVQNKKNKNGWKNDLLVSYINALKGNQQGGESE